MTAQEFKDQKWEIGMECFYRSRKHRISGVDFTFMRVAIWENRDSEDFYVSCKQIKLIINN